ncbi:uncharacterized protein FA14DRAFT_159699 [Meira miltonrushii]|uniref:Thioesterase/thiol ester dehydrase-isomerase n=1 Tax=Meira miltonrushii TaxID=1280837 RepID=A0A316VQR7_9BASI|nr:uncharacterized protein FA14DRAFT_159699 [Meira miltonrushii]PWN37845.1 hypothetical protein FA14DRAFT_159699 [Meira miltonrushii]
MQSDSRHLCVISVDEKMLARQNTIAKLARPCCMISRLFSTTRQQLQQSESEGRPALGHQEENELLNNIRQGKEEMIKMGFHGPSLWIQNICWGDHDQFQHVNNVHYVRFLESNRMLFADKLAEKLEPARRKDIVTGKGESFILQSIAVRYRRPVVYPDTLLIGKKPVLPLGTDRFTLQASIYSLAQKAVVATAEEVCVSYDYRSLSKAPIADDFRKVLEEAGQKPEE